MEKHDFEEYIRQVEPSAKESADAWKTAIGLQEVDGLKPSSYLLETARKNIEGDITIDEVRQLLDSYYRNKTTRTAQDDSTEEADKVAANIKKILSSKTLAFNTNGLISIHRRIFEGVFKHAGEIRKYDISKKEWVLKGDSVHYLNWEDLHRALDFDIQQERDFSYKGLTEEEKIKHITYFVSGLWQIHPFCEGNTRTTAVFTIQYLRSIGYTVDNDMFANHSWYFRNALVRANYKNSALEIDYDTTYLEKFFQNLLLGTKHDLKNRYMVIDTPTYFITDDEPLNQVNEPQNNTDIINSVDSNGGQKNKKVDRKSGQKTRESLLNLIATNSKITSTQMAENLGINRSAVSKHLKKLQEENIIKREGPDKGGQWIIIKNNNP